MITYQITPGTVDVSVVIRIIDSADGTPETGVVYNTSGIDLEYRRELAASTDITEATLAALTTAHADGGFLHIGNGYYRLDLPDAACATGAAGCLVHGTVTGMVVIGCYIQLEALVNDIYSDTTIVTSKTTQIYSDTAIIYSDTTIATSKAVQVYSDTTIIYSDTTIATSKTTQIYSDTTHIDSDATHIESDAARIESKVVQIYSDTTIVTSKTTQIYSDTTAIEAAGGALTAAQDSKLTRVNSKSTQIYSDTTAIHTQTTTASSKAVQIYSDTTIVTSKTTQIYSDTTAIHTQTTTASSKAVQIYSDTTIVTSKTTQIYSDTAVASSKAVQVYSDTTIAVSDTTRLEQGIIFGAAATGTLSTTQATTNLTGYANDQLIGRVLIVLSGAAEGEATDITDYVEVTGLLTFTALTTAMGNTDTFKIV